MDNTYLCLVAKDSGGGPATTLWSELGTSLGEVTASTFEPLAKDLYLALAQIWDLV